jgi:HEAT repeat protein
LLLTAAGAAGVDTDKRPKTVAELIRKLEARDERSRLTAIRQLGRLGVAGREAVPALAKVMLHDPQANVRNQAAQALGQIGVPAVPELVRTLQNRDQATRLRAALALAQIGPEAKEAIRLFRFWVWHAGQT